MDQWYRTLRQGRGAWLHFCQQGTRNCSEQLQGLPAFKEKEKYGLQEKVVGYLKGQVKYTMPLYTHTHTIVPLLPSLSLMKGVCLLMGRLSRASPCTPYWRVQGPFHLSPWQVSDTGPLWQMTNNSLDGGVVLMALTPSPGNDNVQISIVTTDVWPHPQSRLLSLYVDVTQGGKIRPPTLIPRSSTPIQNWGSRLKNMLVVYFVFHQGDNSKCKGYYWLLIFRATFGSTKARNYISVFLWQHMVTLSFMVLSLLSTGPRMI